MQDITLAQLFNQERMKRLIENTAINEGNAYSVFEMLDDLTGEIYSEYDKRQNVDLYRRNLQRTYLEGLQRVLESETNAYEHTDMKAAARLQLTKLKTKFLISRYPDEVTKSHVWDMIERINKILEYKEK